MRTLFKKRGVRIALFYILLSMSLFAYNPKTQALEEAPGNTVTIVATVAPVRYIIVDNSGVIQKIISNTAQNITPLVYSGSLKGQPVPYSETIKKQYELILQSTKSATTPGVIYDISSKNVSSKVGLLGQLSRSMKIISVDHIPLFNTGGL